MSKINMRVLRETTKNTMRVDTPHIVNTLRPISDTSRPDNSSPSPSPIVQSMLACTQCVNPQNRKKPKCLYSLETDFGYKTGPNGQDARKQAFINNDNFGGFMPFICPHDPHQKYMFRKTSETAPELLEMENGVIRWTEEQKDYRIWVKEELTALYEGKDVPSAAALACRNQIRQARLNELPNGR